MNFVKFSELGHVTGHVCVRRSLLSLTVSLNVSKMAHRPIISTTDLMCRKRNHRPENGSDVSKSNPQIDLSPQNWNLTSQKQTHRLENRPVASKTDPLPQEQPHCLKSGPCHLKIGPDISKMDLSPQERPHLLKSGPAISKSDSLRHEWTRHLKS